MLNIINNILKKMIIYKNMFKKLYKITNFSKLYKDNNLLIKKINKHNIVDCYNEINILRLLDSKYIIKIKENYEDTDYLYMVMDYYKKKDLYDNIKKKDINVNKNFIKSIIKPIKILHSNNIVHLDLKLENFLVDDFDNFVLIDFHFSKIHKNPYYKINLMEKNIICGTLNYMAPEMYYNGEYCKATDMYSLGCILFLAFTRKNFEKDNLHLLNNLDNDVKYIIL